MILIENIEFKSLFSKCLRNGIDKMRKMVYDNGEPNSLSYRIIRCIVCYS